MDQYVVRCRATGLYFVDVAARHLLITKEVAQAEKFEKDDAQRVADSLKLIYGGFDWTAVEYIARGE